MKCILVKKWTKKSWPRNGFSISLKVLKNDLALDPFLGLALEWNIFACEFFFVELFWMGFKLPLSK